MELSLHKVVRMDTIIDLVMNPTGEASDKSPASKKVVNDAVKKHVGLENGARAAAVVIDGSAGAFNIYRDLMLHANGGIGRTVKGRDVIREDINNDDAMDDSSRHFLMQWSAFNEWMLNSASLRDPDFKMIEDFDRFELKARLQRMIDSL
jgi:hypothetical protein